MDYGTLFIQQIINGLKERRTDGRTEGSETGNKKRFLKEERKEETKEGQKTMKELEQDRRE